MTSLLISMRTHNTSTPKTKTWRYVRVCHCLG